MKNPLLLSIVAGAVAGIASAFVTSLVLLDPAPRTTEPLALALAPASATESPDSEWKHELELLGAENRELAERLNALEMRTVAEVAREAVVPTPDPAVARLEDELRELVASMTRADGQLPEVLATGVREVLTTIQEEERQEREARYAEAREAELSARLERYATELGLNAYQTNEMRALLTRERQRRDELFVEAREEANFLDLRDHMRDLRDRTKTELERVLTASQLEKYESIDRGRSWFGGGTGEAVGGVDRFRRPEAPRGN